MINIVKVISSKYNDAKQLFVNVRRFGKNDIREEIQVGPAGDDSRPIEKMTAIFSETGVQGDAVIIGYLSEQGLAESGEKRLYSQDDDGNIKFFVWLKKDGTIEIGGDADNAVRYSKLESEFNKLNDKFNDLVTAFNTHQHTGNMGAPTPIIPIPNSVPASPSLADITLSKIDEIKTL